MRLFGTMDSIIDFLLCEHYTAAAFMQFRNVDPPILCHSNREWVIRVCCSIEMHLEELARI